MQMNKRLFAGTIWSFTNVFNGPVISSGMIFIGCIICMFQPPELLRNLGKAESGTKRGTGGMIVLAGRLILKK